MNEQEVIGQMFDRIATTYDVVNRVLSMRQDVRWRAHVAEMLPKDCRTILDVACGTADLAIAFHKSRPLAQVTGVDISDRMLEIGKKKVAHLGLAEKSKLLLADARSLPFADESFDAVTAGFGVRNFTELQASLREMRRVLKPDGQIFILEFSLPKNRLLRALYLLYFRYVLPVVGGILSRDFAAYRYLNETVESFFSAEQFTEILSKSGFVRVSAQPLSCGVATLYCAGKE